MRVVVIGYGVQGEKRARVAGDACVAIVDPARGGVSHRRIEDVDPARFDAAIVCVPDRPKFEILAYLARHGKHALVEKPLWVETPGRIDDLERLARAHRVLIRTAYNHRFEPHFARMRATIASGTLGRLYRCRMFYGNGTARLVRDSAWRDEGAGVLPDLGSHLLDTARFWFGDLAGDFRVTSASRFENRAPDHVVVASEGSAPKIELEMTLLMWRNHFTCDLLAENGSAHIESLCKWGPAKFVLRRRVLPAGRPVEEDEVLVQSDPTWAAEYAAFVAEVAAGTPTDLSADRWLDSTLRRLAAELPGSA